MKFKDLKQVLPLSTNVCLFVDDRYYCTQSIDSIQLLQFINAEVTYLIPSATHEITLHISTLDLEA